MNSRFATAGASLFLLFSAFPQPVSAQEVVRDTPDYIRYRAAGDPANPDFLETAVSRFQRGDHTVDLIAVVHLADAEYYRMLRFALRPYDAVFYEMVGGPYTEEKARAQPGEEADSGELGQVRAFQNMAKKMLGLEFQMDGIDYLQPNFVHADLTAREFLEESGGSLDFANVLARAMQLAESGRIEGMPETEAEANQLMMMLFGAMMSGDTNLLKRTLGPILSQAEAFLVELEEDEGSVLISRRNEIVMERIFETLAASGDRERTDAVLYGAGHMPDLEARLLDAGYEKVSTHWSQSWKIDPVGSSTASEPSLNDMSKKLGDLLESLESAE